MVSQSAHRLVIRETNSVRHELKRTEIEEQTQQKVSTMPEGVAANLTAEQLANLLAYSQSLKWADWSVAEAGAG
jgi:putative heme-binding domain-containing protein